MEHVVLSNDVGRATASSVTDEKQSTPGAGPAPPADRPSGVALPVPSADAVRRALRQVVCSAAWLEAVEGALTTNSGAQFWELYPPGGRQTGMRVCGDCQRIAPTCGQGERCADCRTEAEELSLIGRIQNDNSLAGELRTRWYARPWRISESSAQWSRAPSIGSGSAAGCQLTVLPESDAALGREIEAYQRSGRLATGASSGGDSIGECAAVGPVAPWQQRLALTEPVGRVPPHSAALVGGDYLYSKWRVCQSARPGSAATVG